MRKITIKERNNGMKFCTYCKLLGKKRIDAIYRNYRMQFACEEHKDKLETMLGERGYQTDAEFQLNLK